eukprot:6492351-Amphidinium_carterae.2
MIVFFGVVLDTMAQWHSVLGQSKPCLASTREKSPFELGLRSKQTDRDLLLSLAASTAPIRMEAFYLDDMEVEEEEKALAPEREVASASSSVKLRACRLHDNMPFIVLEEVRELHVLGGDACSCQSPSLVRSASGHFTGARARRSMQLAIGATLVLACTPKPTPA